jgi:hypothetical protein
MKQSKIYRPLCTITLGASLLVGCAVGNKERSISLTPSPHVLTLDADRKAVVDVSQYSALVFRATSWAQALFETLPARHNITNIVRKII